MSEYTSTRAQDGNAGSVATHWRGAHHHRQFEAMGAHPVEHGTHFAVWAPNARFVGVIGSFNGWNCQPLHRIDDGTGRWMGTVANARPGDCYKYRIESRVRGYGVDKADPLAFRAEMPPRTPIGLPYEGR